MNCIECEFVIIDGYYNSVPCVMCGYGTEGTSYCIDGMNYLNRPDKYKCPKEGK